MLSITPHTISPELARQDYELACIQHRITMAGYNALDPGAMARYIAARERKDAARSNLMAAV